MIELKKAPRMGMNQTRSIINRPFNRSIKSTAKVMTNFNFQNESEFENAYQDLITQTDFKRLADKFTVKPFYFKYKPLKTFLSGFTWFIQAVTIAVSFMAIIGLLSPMMPYSVACIFATVALVGIEALKRLTFTPSVKEYLQFRSIPTFPVLIASGMLGVSLWLTWNGSHKAVFELSETPTLLNVDSTVSYEKERIKQINSDIGQAKRITWQGKITEKGQKLIEKLTNERAKVQDKLDSKEAGATAKNDQTTTDHKTATTANATHFKYLTLCLDLLLFALLGWLEYYDYRSITEFSKLKNDAENGNRKSNVGFKDTNNSKAILNENRVQVKGFKRYDDENDIRLSNDNENPYRKSNTIENRIGFKNDIRLSNDKTTVVENRIIEGNAVCQNCNEAFTKNHKKQIYCSTLCRNDYNQRTKGYKIRFKKRKAS
jgi:hypothetical protein